MAASKDAVVFILDTSPSMAVPYPSSVASVATSAETSQRENDGGGRAGSGNDDGGPRPDSERGNGAAATRLSCSTSALVGMVCDLMLRSKTNECGVVLLKTASTSHHLAADEQTLDGTAPFPNLTELSEVMRPTVDLLREIRAVRASVRAEDADRVRGDLCDGIIVAADALHRRTSGKKYNRKLVLFTDAEHEVRVDAEQILAVVEGLRRMGCALTVIGLDFNSSAYFDRPAQCGSGDGDGEGVGGTHDLTAEDSDDETDDDTDDGRGGNESADDNDVPGCNKEGGVVSAERWAEIKGENEKLLISLAKLTGGSVIAASTMREVVESASGRRIPRSTRKKIELVVAPGVALKARAALLISKANLPTLKREAVIIGPDGEVAKNGAGEVMTSAVTSSTAHWDADDDTLEVPLDRRTQAFRYGSDLVPIGPFDLEGLKMRSPVSMEIKGYVGIDVIPRSLHIGPPYLVSGEGKRACTAIAALAQALHRQKHVAVCRFVKSKDADPVIGALYPLESTAGVDRESASVAPRRLFYVQIPFAGDLQLLSMSPLDDIVEDTREADICDSLIDSLMLPPDSLRSERIANPAIRAFNKTMMDRAIDCSSAVAKTRTGEEGGLDLMATPQGLLDDAMVRCEAFRDAFPLEKPAEDQKKRRSRRQFWR